MADVTFTFAGDATALARALESIKGEVARARQSITSMGTSVAGAIAVATTAVAGLKQAFDWVANVPRQAARFEDLQVALSQMMGDATEAGELLNALWMDAANGSVTLEQMAQAAKPLVAVFSNPNTVREWARRFADISTGSGYAVDMLAKMYSRMMQIGKVDSRSVEQLGKAGIPIYQELARVVGVSADRILDMVKKGRVSADQFSQALRNMTDEGGAFYQLSSQLSNTTAGSWGTMMESFNLLAAQLGKPINDAIRPLLQDIGQKLQASIPQMQEFGRQVAGGFTAVIEVASPLVSGLVEIVSALGGLKTVVAAVVSALLLYTGQSNAASISTVTLKAQVAQLTAIFKAFNLASFTAMFKQTMVSIRMALSATLLGMRVAWSTAWTAMVAVTKAAMFAVKASLISTGLGLIIVGVGEALAALYSWITGNSAAAEEAAEANKRFEASLRQLEKSAGKVKTQEQYDSVMESLQEQIDELVEARKQAYTNEDWDKGDQLTEQLAQLWKRQKHYRQTLPLQIEAAKAAEREAEALREQARQAEELQKKLEQARQKMEELTAKQKQKEREDYLSGLDIPQQITLRLSDAGFGSLEELRREMERLSSHEIYDPKDAERYAALVEVYNKIIELQKQQRKLDKDSAKEAEKKRQEDEKRQQEMAATRAEYERQLAILQAEAAQDERRLALLKQEQRITQLTAEYRRQGFADAEQMARRMVQAEQDAEAVREKSRKRDEASARRIAGTWIQSSQASVGGGGRSFLIGGDAILSESKKHTVLLREVRDEVSKQRRDFTVTSVIGK